MADVEKATERACRTREEHIEALTDVAWAALTNAGLTIAHGSRTYEELRDAVRAAL